MENILSVPVGTVNRFLWDYLLIYALLGIGLFLRCISVRRRLPSWARDSNPYSAACLPKAIKTTSLYRSFRRWRLPYLRKSVRATSSAWRPPSPQAGRARFLDVAFCRFGDVHDFCGGTAGAEIPRRQPRQIHRWSGVLYYARSDSENRQGAARFLSGFFSIALIIALGFIGNATQANSIASAVTIAFDVPSLAVGIVLAVLAGMVVIGGVNRIANIAQFVVPFMAVVYILCAVVILFEFSDHIVPMFNHIFTAAFNPEAVLGGAAGIGMREAIRFGVARGLFSNEAGMGSTPHAHATADVKHPVQQGMAAFVGVFIDTILVCTATALIILLTDANLSGEQGAAVTQFAFNKAFPGFGSQLLAVCLTFFAFTTIIGWYYFGESNIRFLFRGRHLGIYRALVLLAIVLGTLGKVDLVWSLSDMFNGFMVIPNLIALFLLRKEIRAIYDDYLAQKKAGRDLSYQYEFHEFHDKG